MCIDVASAGVGTAAPACILAPALCLSALPSLPSSSSSSSSSSDEDEDESLKIALKMSIAGRSGIFSTTVLGTGSRRRGSPGGARFGGAWNPPPTAPPPPADVRDAPALPVLADGLGGGAPSSMLLNWFNALFLVPAAQPTSADFGYGSRRSNRLHSNDAGCHSCVSRVNLPNILRSTAFDRTSLILCLGSWCCCCCRCCCPPAAFLFAAPPSLDPSLALSSAAGANRLAIAPAAGRYIRAA